MIVWLDHKIFGNGHGMASPSMDAKFYWLSGEFYHWFPGLGCQLTSYQWRHPRVGERRTLSGNEYVAWRSGRRWGRVECKWALVRLPHDLNQANAMLRAVEATLGDHFPAPAVLAQAQSTPPLDTMGEKL